MTCHFMGFGQLVKTLERITPITSTLEDKQNERSSSVMGFYWLAQKLDIFVFLRDCFDKKILFSGLNLTEKLRPHLTFQTALFITNALVHILLIDDKTNLLVLTGRHRPQPPIESIVVGSDLIFPSETVKNLGTVFDTSLSLEKQVTAVCKAGFYHLQNIARFRKHCHLNQIKFLFTPSLPQNWTIVILYITACLTS